MQYSLVLLALGASVAVAQQAPGYPLSGCSPSFSGTFSFQTANISSSGKKVRSLDDVLGRRQEASCGGSVTLTLNNGVLLDAKGRTGYIAFKNDQFQFDGPPQFPHSYTSGFALCGNGTLALGGTTIFYNCLSGTFDNIYSHSQGAQCFPVFIETFPCAATGSVASAPTSLISAAGESTDSQVATTSSMSLVAMTAQTSGPISISSVASTSSAASTPSSSAVATPYPIGNSSTIATGTAPGVVTTPAVTSSPGGSSSAPAPSGFKGAASMLVVGQGFVAMVAAAGAFFVL